MAVLPDSSTNNVPPSLIRLQGTQATRKVHMLALGYDGAGTTIESAWWVFKMPADYSSGGSLTILWIAAATSGNVLWGTQVGAITPDDADTPLEHALGAAATTTTNVNTTEQNRLTLTTVTLTMDSAAAGDLIELVVYRDPNTDTCTADANLLGMVMTYTGS
jgi:hypothetical protein